MRHDDDAAIDVALDRDVFLRTVLRELTGALEDVIGGEEARGFVSMVGGRIGRQLDADYRRALNVSQLTRSQIASVLVDLKRRIHGDFQVVEEGGDRIVFRNTRCPFAEEVIGRESLCMMTSSVFGHISAANTGFAKVVLSSTIAKGHDMCEVTVYFSRSNEAEQSEGREYYQARS